MRHASYFSFTWIIAFCGVAALCFMGANFYFWGMHHYPADTRKYVTEGQAARGHVAIERYGCGGCHVIPGIRDAVGRVGPRLDDYAQQSYIGGVLPNAPENLVAWLIDPQQASPRTAMPNLGVSQAEARDMAAYLYQN